MTLSTLPFYFYLLLSNGRITNEQYTQQNIRIISVSICSSFQGTLVFFHFNDSNGWFLFEEAHNYKIRKNRPFSRDLWVLKALLYMYKDQNLFCLKTLTLILSLFFSTNLYNTASSAPVRFHCVGGCWDRTLTFRPYPPLVYSQMPDPNLE